MQGSDVANELPVLNIILLHAMFSSYHRNVSIVPSLPSHARASGSSRFDPSGVGHIPTLVMQASGAPDVQCTNGVVCVHRCNEDAVDLKRDLVVGEVSGTSENLLTPEATIKFRQWTLSLLIAVSVSGIVHSRIPESIVQCCDAWFKIMRLAETYASNSGRW